jgi:hypothetical protein
MVELNFLLYDVILMIVLAACLENHRTIFNTCTAPSAAVFDNGAGAFLDFYLEISGGAFYTFKIRIGNQFNV